MGFIKKKLGELKETVFWAFDEYLTSDRKEVMGDLCEHLQQIGVKGILLDPDSPESFRFPPIVIGCVKIEGRNIDVIFAQRTSVTYEYYYVMRVNVEGLESKLYANLYADSNWHNRCCLKKDFKWIDKSLINQEVSNSRWERGELAQLLNADSDLTYTL